MTRCGCLAKCCVCVDRESGRWRVKCMEDVHNHKLLFEEYVGMLAAHRKMNESEIMQMNSMREAGIGVTQIYGLTANQYGGYNRVGYRKKDMYNEIVKQRRIERSDARSALLYLRQLRHSNPILYWRHTADEEGRLQHLFWCDGRSQSD
ncbi:FAR1 DNA-binding domain protein [Sesbania bispinosa]|nr:FAR1 DNA-binding domain protein [Sesbania bispinosa]